MAVLDEKGNIHWGTVITIGQIIVIICTLTYVFAVTDARTQDNSKSIQELKRDTNQELRYIRTRIDYLIELQLEEK